MDSILNSFNALQLSDDVNIVPHGDVDIRNFILQELTVVVKAQMNSFLDEIKSCADLCPSPDSSSNDQTASQAPDSSTNDQTSL